MYAPEYSISPQRKRASTAKSEKMSVELKHALKCLGYRDLDQLQHMFLAKESFLVPWAFFRDTFLFRQEAGMPRASLPGSVTREDILWWYTRYDDGILRYDPNDSDDKSALDDKTASRIDDIDTSAWSVIEHEKHLFVWLLQAFKVGKAKNPYGITYFECRNVCAAWEEVLLPIVNDVREGHDIRGRRHYGELAAFVDKVSPSALAFPEKNVGVRRRDIGKDRSHRVGMLARKKQLDEDDMELRHTYPQFGQVAEKQKVDLKAWIRDKKTVADRKMAMKFLEGSPCPPKKLAECASSWIKSLSFSSLRHQSNDSSHSTPSKKGKEVFGSTRPTPENSPLSKKNESPYGSQRGKTPLNQMGRGNRTPSTELVGVIQRKPSQHEADGLYKAIRTSNPFANDIPKEVVEYTVPASDGMALALNVKQIASSGLNGSMPYNPNKRDVSKESKADVKEGGGSRVYGGIPVGFLEGIYAGTILVDLSLTNDLIQGPDPFFENKHTRSNESVAARRAGKMPATRIPSPVNVGPAGPPKYHPTRPRSPPPYAVEEDDQIPPIPPKNPHRYAASNVKPTTVRIVSKDNIRAALSTHSSQESLAEVAQSNRNVSASSEASCRSNPFAVIGGRGFNTGEYSIHSYNSHMFHRDRIQEGRGH
ncbi:uncharacterized protein BDR25DRAFT_311796 [Lindgomyces ingoldianus]|uniref:Uncharacterized protein n=1 Tax=Lindgomyces ingoldianus TaxID=673940 RepID=A0ACB6R5I7_9PLEO|nr:uncharacterized protein BDR25DRAFT_311796 [Lindgomyces ingoldianus]KAF2473557.1 hypothetical protein BDR25DRAFT_311796 [Lindgomyces ingoldianus]